MNYLLISFKYLNNHISKMHSQLDFVQCKGFKHVVYLAIALKNLEFRRETYQITYTFMVCRFFHCLHACSAPGMHWYLYLRLHSMREAVMERKHLISSNDCLQKGSYLRGNSRSRLYSRPLIPGRSLASSSIRKINKNRIICFQWTQPYFEHDSMLLVHRQSRKTIPLYLDIL